MYVFFWCFFVIDFFCFLKKNVCFMFFCLCFFVCFFCFLNLMFGVDGSFAD